MSPSATKKSNCQIPNYVIHFFVIQYRNPITKNSSSGSYILIPPSFPPSPFLPSCLPPFLPLIFPRWSKQIIWQALCISVGPSSFSFSFKEKAILLLETLSLVLVTQYTELNHILTSEKFTSGRIMWETLN